MSRILERIEREAGIPGLASILAERLTPTDLQSLLLEVYRLRAGRARPSEVLASYQENRFVRPAAVSPVDLARWEQVALANLPAEFQPVTLSPVCPLGTNSALAPVDQNWAVTTVRNTEVVADSTTVLALECALRRRELLRADPRSAEPVHLAASHRLLRAQKYEAPGLVPHFSTFVLASAGRDRGNRRFELQMLGAHVRFYLRALRAYAGDQVGLRLTVTGLTEGIEPLLEEQLLSPLRAEFAGVQGEFDESRTSGRRYYREACFHIYVTVPDGRELELVDGGAVDWTQRLLGSAKERLVTSGIGNERLCGEFGGQRSEVGKTEPRP